MPSILAEPISPVVLATIGRGITLPAPGVRCRADAPWRATWSVHSIHGWRDNSIGDLGTVQITHRPGAITVIQQHGYKDGVAQQHAAEITYRDGPLPTIATYEVDVLTTIAGAPAPDLCGTYGGRWDGERWEHREGRFSWQRAQHQPLTCDWLLLATLAHLRPADILTEFTVLDQASVAKPEQTLRRRPDLDQQLADGLALACWTRLGHGIFPTEYWCSDDGQMAMVTAGNRWWALTGMESVP